MSQALSNMSFTLPLHSSNKTNYSFHLPFSKLPQNRCCFKAMAMAGERSNNLNHLQRLITKPQHSQTNNKKRVGHVSPIGLWDRFPTARTVQQMMETMEMMMEDPFAYSGTWPSPLTRENNGYNSRGRRPWEIKEREAALIAYPICR